MCTPLASSTAIGRRAKVKSRQIQDRRKARRAISEDLPHVIAIKRGRSSQEALS
jgi:hypothetical protein